MPAESQCQILDFAGASIELKPSSVEALQESSVSWLAMAVIEIDESARLVTEGGALGLDRALSQISYAESKLARARRDLLEAKALQVTASQS